MTKLTEFGAALKSEMPMTAAELVRRAEDAGFAVEFDGGVVVGHPGVDGGTLEFDVDDDGAVVGQS